MLPHLFLFRMGCASLCRHTSVMMFTRYHEARNTHQCASQQVNDCASTTENEVIVNCTDCSSPIQVQYVQAS